MPSAAFSLNRGVVRRGGDGTLCRVVPTVAPTAAHARDELVHRATSAKSVRELFRVASKRLRRLVPFDAAVWVGCDPATGLPTAPTRTENMNHFGLDACMRGWELEFMVEDVNLYSTLAHAGAPAAGLRQATGDRPTRSPRFRDVVKPHGFGDELRGVLRVGGRPWALLALFRADGRRAFGADESDLVAGLSEPLALAVREHARSTLRAPVRADRHGPGVMLFAPGGELISVNDDALAWLDEIAGVAVERRAFAFPLPIVVVSTLMRARAIAEERERGSARARVRSRASNRWLVCNASCMRDAEGNLGNTALVIEPAQVSEIAPIVTQAYALSAREQQITQLVARGLGTAAIADELFLSTHTVRDYVKAIFDKVGVSSRGELVAKLFAEHYAPIHLDPDSSVHTADE
jgi:DNA-binding NarL/FixJ family response regulator